MDYNRSTIHSSTFEQIIASYYQDIKKYCFTLTSNKWEGEDLFQETLMKLYLALKRQPDRTLTKRFFYQVARNTWIDQLRKQKVTTESFEENKYPGNDREDFFQIRESLEILAEYLTVKQFVIVLFMDVFQFTAQETADMIGDTQANMYTILQRSRKKLKKCIDLATEPKSAYKKLAQTEKQSLNHSFETFVEGVTKRDPKLIYTTYLSLVENDITITKIQTIRGAFYFHFTDPDGNVWMICEPTYNKT